MLMVLPYRLTLPVREPFRVVLTIVCVYYEQLSPGLAGQGGYQNTRSNDGLPVTSFMRFDPEQVVVA
jgi:hypothetical protein